MGKGKYSPGELVCWFEVDSFLPVKPQYEFLRKNCFKSTKNLGDGFRLKTMKLRGVLSQGLILSLGECDLNFAPNEIEEGLDATMTLGVQKYEKPIPANLAGIVKGNFPSFLQKTDQERVQNIFNCFGYSHERYTLTYLNETTGEKIDVEKPFKLIRDQDYEVTVKLDGTSATYYLKDGVFGVCSRNLELKETEDNLYWKIARKYNIEESMKRWADLYSMKNFAIQGEIIGEGVQHNPEKITGQKFFLFDVYDIDKRQYILAHDRHYMCGFLLLDHIPTIDVREFDFKTIEEALVYAEGPSLNPEVTREGVVFKSMVDPSISFKIISNKYLLENE